MPNMAMDWFNSLKDKDVQIFPDVGKGSWYEKEVNDLFLNGIISGNRDGKFYPG